MRDWIFWTALTLMVIGFVIPGTGVIGAQMLIMRG